MTENTIRLPALFAASLLSFLAVPALSQDGAESWGKGIRKEHPRVLLNAETKARLRKLLANKAPAAARFQDMVDRAIKGGNVYGFEAWCPALLYQLTGDAKYAEKAVSMVDAKVAAEEKLIAEGKRANIGGDSYLYVGPGIRSLVYTYDWCHDQLTGEQKKRWIAYANQSVWNVWHPNKAHWGKVKANWSGWSVNNPGNNYYYSFLTATATLGLATWGENDQAKDWLSIFRNEKIEKQVIPYFGGLAGGGSREGTGYGTAQRELFELFDLWRSSTGEDISSRLAHPRDSIFNMIHLRVPTLDRIAPVGDHARDSSAALFDYHRAYLLVLVSFFRDDPAGRVGQWVLNHCSVPQMRNQSMYVTDFLRYDPAIPELPLTALSTAYYAPGTGTVYLRSSWDKDATWLHFMAGKYDGSHAHRDQGSFLLYKNEWLAFDENILTHSGIAQSDELHNLVRFVQGGKTVGMCYTGTESKVTALESSDQFDYVAGDMSGAWKHREPRFDRSAVVKQVFRQILFVKPNVVIIYDRGETAAGIERVWQLNTPAEPQIAEGPVVTLGKAVKLALCPLTPGGKAEKVDWKTVNPKEFVGGWRIDILDGKRDPAYSFLTLLHIDGAVKEFKAVDADSTEGLEATLADGRVVEASFARTGEPGGSLKITKGGTVLHDAKLAVEVRKPPVFSETP
jgi:hypothetical protein